MTIAINIGEALKLGENGQSINQATQFQSFGAFLSQTIIPNVLVIANIILFFLILFGGFTLITNAGNPDKQKQGAQTLTAALIGFILIFTAYWIMQIIGIITGFDFFNSSI